jgi:hypothetical protein
MARKENRVLKMSHVYHRGNQLVKLERKRKVMILFSLPH